MNRPGEKLVWSTRWFDVEADQSDNPLPKPVVQIEVVIVPESHDERHAALSRRPNLFNFLKSEVRSHVAA
ncbi:MAG: hypothetical protein KJ077_46035 [Anaerolineae bacterium]|nr:hypothetical protein [Anaerolineae bacterium]